MVNTRQNPAQNATAAFHLDSMIDNYGAKVIVNGSPMNAWRSQVHNASIRNNSQIGGLVFIFKQSTTRTATKTIMMTMRTVNGTGHLTV